MANSLRLLCLLALFGVAGHFDMQDEQRMAEEINRARMEARVARAFCGQAMPVRLREGWSCLRTAPDGSTVPEPVFMHPLGETL